MKEWKAVSLVFCGGVLAALLLLEILLRFYNPFGFRLKGDEIQPPAGKTYKIEHHAFTRLDPVITHTKNSLGFRGAEPPADLNAALGVVAVGGSTTECFYLSDGTTWSDRLAQLAARDFAPLWLNNAGLDGHSTYGHDLLVRQHLLKLRPKVIIFLAGLNDIGRGDIRGGPSWLLRLARHSQLFSIAENMSRFAEAKRRGLVHEQIDFKALPEKRLDVTEESALLVKYTPALMEAYRARVAGLIKLCRDNGIEPVFLTQPALYGFGTDPRTGADLAAISVGQGNGSVSWKKLEMYNDIVRTECARARVLCVDLADKMPKNSDFYYDFYHFTPAGAEKVADIVYAELGPFLRKRYPSFGRGGSR